VPGLLMLRPEKVATPLTALTVVVPLRVPLLGLAPIRRGGPADKKDEGQRHLHLRCGRQSDPSDQLFRGRQCAERV
jgi:hypothetical protein